MDEKSKGGTIFAIAALALLFVLLPVMLIGTAAEEEESPNRFVGGCIPEGETDIVVPAEYVEPIKKASQTAMVPEAVLTAQLWHESRFDPNAVSPSGARGIAQFMPDVWPHWGNGADPFDPIAGIDAQGRLMADHMKTVSEIAETDEQRIQFALAAYNAGAGEVLRAGGIPPIPETQDYVKKIMGDAQINTENCTPPGVQIGELGTGEWTHPLPGGVMTSGYGYRDCIPTVPCTPEVQNHNGMDFSTPGPGVGTVVAPVDLEITSFTDSWDASYRVTGRMVEEPHLVMIFSHCEANSRRVNVGDVIAPGTPICTEGATGPYAFGAHLHFQVHPAEVDDTRYVRSPTLDPGPLLTQKGVKW